MGSRGWLPVATRWPWLDWPGWSRVSLAAAYFAALNWLLLAPSSTFQGVETFPNEDKVVHGTIFLLLTLAVRWAVPGRLGHAGQCALAAALVAYACGMETLQPVLTADRQFDWWDMACNVMGVGVGWPLFAAFAAPAPALGGSGSFNSGRAVR